jgi:transposase
MTRPGRYPQELRERAVRMVFEHQDEHSSQWAAITSIAEKFGVSSETLRKWVRRAETDGGLRPGLTTDERERLKGLERGNRELRAIMPYRGSVPGQRGARCLTRRPATAGAAIQGGAFVRVEMAASRHLIRQQGCRGGGGRIATAGRKRRRRGRSQSPGGRKASRPRADGALEPRTRAPHGRRARR